MPDDNVAAPPLPVAKGKPVSEALLNEKVRVVGEEEEEEETVPKPALRCGGAIRFFQRRRAAQLSRSFKSGLLPAVERGAILNSFFLSLTFFLHRRGWGITWASKTTMNE
jgi:hypothetical protein